MIKKKIQKVMLIYPTGKIYKGRAPHCEIPMGLAYLAAVLRDEFEVKIFDGRSFPKRFKHPHPQWEYFGYTPKEIALEIEQYQPDLVGITCLSSFHFPEVLDLAKRTKSINKDILTLTGGSHPTFLAKQILKKHSIFDFIILGEGEKTLLSLLKAINRGKSYTHLDGLAFTDKGKIFINPKTQFIADLDTLPFPALDLFPLKFYEKHGIPFSVTSQKRKTAPIITSRGCQSNCIFCASKNYWGKKYRVRSANNVLDEIEFLVHKYGFEEIQFIDDNLTLDRPRAREIFNGLIKRKLHIKWNTPNGIAVWTLDEKMLELMKASGCYELTVAFESGVQEVINKIIKKPLNLDYAVKMVNIMKKLKIQVHSFFICGFPGETKEQIKETFSFANKIGIDSAWFFVANPTPGSHLYDLCIEKGYLSKNFNFDNIAYDLPHINTEHFTGEEVQKLVLKESVKFDLRIIFYHPIKFLRKYFLIILSHPIITFRSFFTDVWRIIKG